MAEETLETRVSALEQRMLEVATRYDLQAMQAALSTQIVQLGHGMRAGFSALRAEMRAGDEETRGLVEERTREILAVVAAGDEETRRVLREEIRAGDEETRRVLREEIRVGDEESRRQMRVLYEDAIARIGRTKG